jgi:hypothetical protein
MAMKVGPTLDDFAHFRMIPQKVCVYLCVSLRKCLMLNTRLAGSNAASRTIFLFARDGNCLQK